MADEKSPLGITLQAAALATVVFSGAGFLAVRAHLQSLQLPSHVSPDAQGYLQMGGRIAFSILGQLVPVLAALLLLWLAGSLLARLFPGLARLPHHRAAVAVGLPLLAAGALACELSVLDTVVNFDDMSQSGAGTLLRPVLLAEALLAASVIWVIEARLVVAGMFQGSFVQRQFSTLALVLIVVAMLLLPVAFGRTELPPARLDRVQVVTGHGEVKGLLVFSDASSHFIWTERRALTEIARNGTREIRYEPRAAAVLDSR